MPRPPNNAAQDAGTEPTHLARAHRDRCSTAGVRGVRRAARMRGVRRAARMRGVRRAARMRGVRRAARMRGVRRATRMRGVRRATRMRGAWPGLPGGSPAPPAPGWASPWAAPGQSGRSAGGERAEAGAALEGRCRGTQACARGRAGGGCGHGGGGEGSAAGRLGAPGRGVRRLQLRPLGGGRREQCRQRAASGGRSAAAAPGLALLPSGLGVHCAARSHRFYSYSVIPAGLRAWRITVALSHLRCPQTAENIIFLKSATIFPVTSYNCMPKAGTVAGQGASFPLWKVCSGAECKPSLCSRLGQWPPGVTLQWEWKPSLVALASGRELVRQVCTNIIERNANLEWNQVVNLQIKKYQRRLKCSLSAVFHSAIMLQDVGEAIQFEVSIGNYGNKFDATCNPLASTTQYSRAVFDGNYYYYLPWAHTKPIVTLTSYWEDISYRLDAVNTLLVMAEWLQSNIEAVKSGIQGKIPANQLVEVWLKLIDEVIEDMRIMIPKA
ncbi:uncharacterized protein LOC127673181 [Apodemus sylvaticus]|uniref:uncharacterized protein LOC127673181 n=1 Tax=Apodemus sylvaticus TaxID=10129 RepID=UPI002242E62D|nr:uncharacterized protein LOC127673181 [Apodemus sylvaticus]